MSQLTFNGEKEETIKPITLLGLSSYLLRRIADNPKLAYFFDPMSESYGQITQAYAQEKGIDVEEFRRKYKSRLCIEAPKRSR